MQNKQVNLHSRRDAGVIDIPVLGFTLTIFILIISVGSTLIYGAIRERNVVQSTLETSIKNAVVASVNGPLFINGQGTINQGILQAAINDQLNKTLSYLEPVVTLTAPPVVYSDSDKGMPTPGGLGGTIPGPSVYLELKLTWHMPSVMGYRFQGSIPDKTLITYPVFNSVNQTWITPQ